MKPRNDENLIGENRVFIYHFPFLHIILTRHSGLEGEIQEKKMSPKICQWIPSPKYILTLISYDPKSENGVFLKCQIFTIFQ